MTQKHNNRTIRMFCSEHAKAGYWATIDQAIISGSNFITMVILARHLSPENFGLYTLLYAILLFTAGVQSSLITQPHNVLGSKKTVSDLRDHSAALLYVQLIYVASLAMISIICAYTITMFEALDAESILFLGLYVCAWTIQEYTRRCFYTVRMHLTALVIDLIGYAGQVAVLFALVANDSLDLHSAILSGGITSLVAALYGAYRYVVYYEVRFIVLSAIADTTRQHWAYGKWLLWSVLARYFSSNLFPFLTAGLLSLNAAGILNACRTLSGIVNLATQTLNSYLPPRAATVLHNHGPAALTSFLAKTGWVISIPIAVFFAFIVIFPEEILDTLYGGDYASEPMVLQLVMLAAVIQVATQLLSSGLKSLGYTKSIFYANIITTVFTMTGGIYLIHTSGIVGSAACYVISALILLISLKLAYKRSINRYNSRADSNDGIPEL